MAAGKGTKTAKAPKGAKAVKTAKAVKSPKALKTAKRATATPPAKTPPRPRLTKAARAAQRQLIADATLTRLRAAYPDARCALTHRNAFELLCATILSAQCTDARVNIVTPALFAAYPTPAGLAAADVTEVERLVHSTGFYRNKAKNLVAMAQALVRDHGGDVPRSMEALHVLPGVGRKTANVVLGNAFGIQAGITVDTHVTRIANLLGLVKTSDAVKIERELCPLFPQPEWAMVTHLLIYLGRDVCLARRPQCGRCPLADLCPSARRES